MTAWTVTRRRSEHDILVERPGVTGPVVIVRVAPPFGAEAWREAEQLATYCAGVAALPEDPGVVVGSERARAVRAEAERDEARAELRAARAALGTAWLIGGASIADGIRFKTATLDRLAADTETELDRVRQRAREYHRRAQKAEAQVRKTHAELAPRGPAGLGRAFANVAAATWKRTAEEALSQLALAMHWGRELAARRREAFQLGQDCGSEAAVAWLLDRGEQELAEDLAADAGVPAGAVIDEGFDQDDVDRVFGPSVTGGDDRG